MIVYLFTSFSFWIMIFVMLQSFYSQPQNILSIILDVWQNMFENNVSSVIRF